ncbi:hypothetical protein F2Q68_00023240 [Brassica cretica]|uniref:Methyltransferase n=1 Tax=Brassica cretica TaxID=69181 RepID=A0A8S9FY57_BRACR|nr:hypothetical protein F2Q68_00023240 [Brassica cretica]
MLSLPLKAEETSCINFSLSSLSEASQTEPDTFKPLDLQSSKHAFSSSWCEPFDTYPRTYDLLHAAGLFSIERKRCNMTTIMLEMDRIFETWRTCIRKGHYQLMSELQEIGNAKRSHTTLRETAEGPHASYRVLLCEKKFEKKVKSSVDKHHTKKKRNSKGKRV